VVMIHASPLIIPNALSSVWLTAESWSDSVTFPPRGWLAEESDSVTPEARLDSRSRTCSRPQIAPLGTFVPITAHVALAARKLPILRLMTTSLLRFYHCHGSSLV
jgi:hypothetical protein